MKAKAFFLVLFFIPCFLVANTLEFQSPTFEEPYFRILFSLEVGLDNMLFKGVRLNGERWENFLVFQEGKRADLSKPLVKGTYDFLVDYAWMSKKDYEVLVLLQAEGSTEIKGERIRGASPDKGGIPSNREGFYRIFVAEETAGLQRKGEIACLTLTVPKAEFGNDSFVIFDGDFLVDCQILDVKESTPPEQIANSHPVTKTYKVAIPVDISPWEKKMYLVLKGERASTLPQGFTITGEGIGKTVKGKFLSLEFHPQSGQINIIETEGVRLYNEAGVIHWNPDVFIPGVAWDHSFDWSPPPSYEEKNGIFIYTNSRRGPFKTIKDATLEVKYTMEAYSPYFLSETMVRVDKDLGIIALRNDEMVLYKELFDTLIYRAKSGKVIKIPLEEKPQAPYGLVHIAPDDADWVGLLNTKEMYGFFSLRIKYTNSRVAPSGDWLHKPGTYFYAPSDGKYVYWVRPLLYTWGEFLTSNLLTFVPAGSTFYEKNAYIILPLEKKFFGISFTKKLDLLLEKLRNPVRIY